MQPRRKDEIGSDIKTVKAMRSANYSNRTPLAARRWQDARFVMIAIRS
jgi:hypothetical protein